MSWETTNKRHRNIKKKQYVYLDIWGKGFLSGSKNIIPSQSKSKLKLCKNPWSVKSLQYIAGCIVHKLHKKFKFCNSSSEIIICKTDWSRTLSLICIEYRGGLWRVIE